MDTQFITAVRRTDDGALAARTGYPWELPAIAQLVEGVRLDPKVTYLIGENGSGKSTLLEAIAIAAGMNPEGGSSNFAFPTDDAGEVLAAFAFSRRKSHRELSQVIRLARGARRPRTDYFLRAESQFVAATYLEQLPDNPLAAYGEASLHEQSHGQALLAIMLNRFAPDGLYLLDEPEAALSTQNCLTFLRRVHQLVRAGRSSSSPPIRRSSWPTQRRRSTAAPRPGSRPSPTTTEPVRLTTSFLTARERFLEQLLNDE
jgi:predicted ATPase